MEKLSVAQKALDQGKGILRLAPTWGAKIILHTWTPHQASSG